MDSARSLPKKFCAPFDPARMDSPRDRRRRPRGSCLDAEFTVSSVERPDEEADDAVEYDRWSSGMPLRSGVEEPIEVSIGVKMSSLLKGAIVCLLSVEKQKSKQMCKMMS
jgi:hypothetical protein